MLLCDLVKDLGPGAATISGDPNTPVTGMTQLPNRIKPGWLYVASQVPGRDGYAGIRRAIERQASGVVIGSDRCEKASGDVPFVTVEATSKAYSIMAAAFFCHMHRRLKLIAITGTKGKTTVCYILEAILKAAGINTGLITTVCIRCPDWRIRSINTTPEAFSLHYWLARMAASGTTHVIIEASSIGIAEERLHGLRFEAVALTNLGTDHLEYHGSADAYKAAKLRLFTEFSTVEGLQPVRVINIEDPFGNSIVPMFDRGAIAYGAEGSDAIDIATERCQSSIRGKVEGLAFESRLFGKHNASNIACAATVARGLQIDAAHICAGIDRAEPVPGRLEEIAEHVFVDYAHTPESVRSALGALQARFPRQPLVAIIGCGGGARSNRAEIARATLEHANVCIFTSDNPRWEDPRRIIGDMTATLDLDELLAAGRLQIVVDRKEAIYQGIGLCKRLDGVLAILGKGHETAQEIKGHRKPFSDKEIALQALEMHTCYDAK